MTYMKKKQSGMESSSPTSPGRETLAMSRDSRVISKVQPPKIRVIHLLPPKIHHADVADFRDVVQRLTGKHGGMVKLQGQKGKQEEAMTMITCDDPTVIIPKVEAEMMGTPGSSPSLSDHHHWRPSSSSSSLSGDDHNNNMFSGRGYVPILEVDNDGFDFTSLFNFENHDHHDQSSSGDYHNNDVLSSGGHLSTFDLADYGFDFNSLFNMQRHNFNPFGEKFN